MSLRPKKSLGQNFLTSIPARLAIVKAGEVTPLDFVLEIGPGKGFLTEELLRGGATVVALEKDRELIPYLTEKFASYIEEGKCVLLEGDVLRFDPSATILKEKDYKLIANIPYYITGAILSRFLSEVKQPSKMVVLVQKEVAVRVCAQDKKESLLSLSVKAYGSPVLSYKVNKGSFHPIPKVDSAVLSISSISRNHFVSKKHEEVFFELIHLGFAHKRKMMFSNMKEKYTATILEKNFIECNLSLSVRAEDVPLNSWLLLSQKIADVI